MDHCEIPRCLARADLTYLGYGVCEKHWDELTADDAPPDALRVALGFPVMPDAATEDVMDSEKSKVGEVTEAPVKPAKGKKTGAKATVKATAPKAKAAKKEKPANVAKPEREKVENPVVFAFRLGANDRDRIHAAAGPAGATRFVRSAALAAATGNRDAFDALVTQARANQK